MGFVLPASLYAAIYVVFSYPVLKSFSTHYFCGHEDGYQNIWNLWWVNKSIAQLHQLPWYTTYLHYPTGTTLIAHTLAPFNGFIGVLLQARFLADQTYNTIVIFSFVMTGVTTFWLARRVTGVVRRGAVRRGRLHLLPLPLRPRPEPPADGHARVAAAGDPGGLRTAHAADGAQGHRRRRRDAPGRR